VDSNSVPGEKAWLLKNVSGFFLPGEMTALMGPSGSGKTTLLDVLAGRKTVGQAEGTILLSGIKPSTAFLRRFTGYVEQFDTLLPILTVEEMLLYTAELKRPLSEPFAAKKAVVESVIGSLGLASCRDVMCGDAAHKGISGGQAKRVNIGLALVTNPRVMFLDEPTSGLDSFTANEVMSTVRALVGDGTTICATIHSPTSYAFGLFDSLMMLTGGRVVYFGPRAGAAIEYALAAWPNDGNAGALANEAEWLVDLITKADRDGRGAAFAETYDASERRVANAKALEAKLADRTPLPSHLEAELAVQHTTVTPWWWGFKTIVKYRTPKNYRDRACRTDTSSDVGARCSLPAYSRVPGAAHWRQVSHDLPHVVALLAAG
jgi:ABC-type multidrug transport system ATPase subunit